VRRYSITGVFDFPFEIALLLLSKGLFFKPMSSISNNKLYVLFFGPKLQLYLQINNSKRHKPWDSNLMLHKKMGWKKKDSKTRKVDLDVALCIESFANIVYSNPNTSSRTNPMFL
jgi:hypothetical protein